MFIRDGTPRGFRHDVQRTSIGQIRHILLRHDAGYDTLVTMTTRHLIAHLQLTLLSDVAAYHHVDAGCQFIAVFPGEYLDIHDDAVLTMGNTQRGITHFPCLFTEDGPEQTLLGIELGLALGGDLAHQNIAGTHFGAHTDNTALVQFLERRLHPRWGYPG